MATVSWDQLVADVRRIFSSNSIDIDEVKQLMGSYDSNRIDWGSYEKFDDHTYTRNLVDEGNGSYNLIVLCWDSGQGSCIHSHANSHCFMKVLRGSLKETLYEWPSETPSSGGVEEGLTPMTVKESNTYKTDEVTYINDSIGLHRVENPSHTDPAVSLHLYCPPIRVCKSFEERTGRCHTCTVSFHSSKEQEQKTTA